MNKKILTHWTPLIIGIILIIGIVGMGINIKNQPSKQFPQLFGGTYCFPSQGCTGTSTNPSYGQVLVGNSGGTYSLTSTSSLNISASVPAGTYDPYGQATSTLNSFTGGATGYYATTTHPLISSLPSLSITKSQVSDFGTYESVLTFNSPLQRSSNTISYSGLATTSQPSSSNLLVSNGGAGVYGVATTTLTGTAPIVFSQPISVIGGSASVITCNVASGAQAGCLSAANWNTFNGKQDTISATYPIILTGATLSFPATSTLYGTGSYGQFLMWGTQPTWTATSTLTLAGDVSGTLGVTIVGNDSHDHTASTISGLSVSDFTSPNISNWTNDSLYITQAIASTTFADKTLYVPYTGATANLNLGLFNASTTQLTTTGSTYLATTGGNVGIGTTTPVWQTQIAGTRPSLAISDTSAPVNKQHWLLSSMGGNMYIGTSTDSYSTSTPPALTILNNGNVGIGIANPVSQFQIRDSMTLGVAGLTNGVIETPSIMYFNFDSNNDGTSQAFVWAKDRSGISGGIELMRIIENGSVGIGTTSPYSKLTVWGTGTLFELSNTSSSTAFSVLSTGLTTMINASSTLFSSSYASSTAGYFGSITMTGDFTPNTSFGGNYATVNGSAIDVDVELATEQGHFVISSSTMSTTTPWSGLKRYFPVASTIVKVWCSTDVGTSTIQIEERASSDPNAAGTDILFAGGLRCGSGSGQVASSTMANVSIDADDIVVPEVLDASPVGGTLPKFINIYFSYTKND